ncbi:hypothetical protein ES703_116915 [subsurface metagenome]
MPENQETPQLLCNNDSSIINDAQKAHDRIYFDRDDKGPLIKAFTLKTPSLLKENQNFIMTRYNGSNKIFIYMGG